MDDGVAASIAQALARLQKERLMQERERLMVALNPIEAGIEINPRPMAAGLSPRLQPVESAGD